MEQSTLYRKYRPKDFDTVVGQEHIIRTLKNQILKGENGIAHAYLFSGTRGTGKTTIAKIFARAINCQNQINGNPCNECGTCTSAIDGSNLNIVELDAASNNGVDSIRHISELIEYPPINDEKYKVFIIDEVHALTGSAEQAFLKILEEPPKYVVYILATTDPNKLPETILSRCQRYNFKRITIEDIVKYLRKICDKESINIDDDSLYFIADRSDGSMREALSILDRCRAYAIKDILDKKAVVEILGIVGDEEFSNLLISINKGDVKDAIGIIADAVDKGKEISTLVSDFIWFMRNILITKDLTSEAPILGITKNNFIKYKSIADKISKEELIYFISEFSKTFSVLKHDENKRAILETTIIRLATPESDFSYESLMARIAKIENGKSNKVYIEKDLQKENIDKLENVEKEEKEVKEEKKNLIKEIKLSKRTYDEVKKLTDAWDSIASTLDRISKTIIKKAKLIPGDKEDTGYIKVLIEDKIEYDLLVSLKKIDQIEKELAETSKNLLGMDLLYKVAPFDKENIDKDIKLILDETLKDIIDVEI